MIKEKNDSEIRYKNLNEELALTKKIWKKVIQNQMKPKMNQKIK